MVVVVVVIEDGIGGDVCMCRESTRLRLSITLLHSWWTILWSRYGVLRTYIEKMGLEAGV